MYDRDSILERLKSNVTNKIDKNEGSFIYDSLSTTAIEFEKSYSKINEVEKKLDIENLSGGELEGRIYQKTGERRKKGTKATGELELTGNATIKIGDLFATKNGVNFKSVENKKIENVGTIQIAAVETGKVGVVPAEQITEMPVVIVGITKVTNINPTYDGFDAETDDELIKRYYEIIRTPLTTANKAQYKNWVKQVGGVGDAKVFPLWSGDSTVKVVIIDMNKKPASSDLVSKVQKYIDPEPKGQGNGISPLGFFCTIESAKGKSINLKFKAIKDSSLTGEQIIENLKINLEKLFMETSFNNTVLSYAKIGALILDTKGFLDYSNLTVNEEMENISLQDNEVPIIGVITIE